MTIRLSEEELKKLLGDKYPAPPKEKQPGHWKKDCIHCKKPILISKHQGFACDIIPNTNPAEAECYHLDCEEE